MVDADKRTPSPGYGQTTFFANTPNKAAKYSRESRPRRSESLIDTQPGTPTPRQGNKERLTELENQVSNLNHKFIDLVGKIDELVSSVKPDRVVSGVSADPVADDSTVVSSIVESDDMVIDESIVDDECCPNTTVGLPTPNEGTVEQGLAHPVGFTPINPLQRQEL